MSRICAASATTSMSPPSAPSAPGSVTMGPLGTIRGTGQEPPVDEVLGQHVVVGLEDAGADDEGVAALQECARHRGHVEDVALGRGGRHPVVVEDEVQRPADVGVRVAQPGDHRRAVQVDHAHRSGVDVEAPRRHRDDPFILDEDVAT